MSFKRRLVTFLAVTLGIVLVLGTFFVRRQLAYPAAWDQVHVGMSRQEVYDRIGAGGGEWPGWKGPFWYHRNSIMWHELQMSMTGDRVQALWITRYVGQHHSLGVVRREGDHF